jgi:hypothetical protein
MRVVLDADNGQSDGYRDSLFDFILKKRGKVLPIEESVIPASRVCHVVPASSEGYLQMLPRNRGIVYPDVLGRSAYVIRTLSESKRLA